MTPQQQAEAILEKYTILLSLNKVQVEHIEDTSIQCAITEVEACMNYARSDLYRMGNSGLTDMRKLELILEHLKQM